MDDVFHQLLKTSSGLPAEMPCALGPASGTWQQFGGVKVDEKHGSDREGW